MIHEFKCSQKEMQKTLNLLQMHLPESHFMFFNTYPNKDTNLNA